MPLTDNKFERHNKSIHHPSMRCDAVIATGPCPYNKHENSNFCPMHGYNNNTPTSHVENYRLQRWQQRVSDFAQNDQVKSLREEVGILRMTLEEMLNKCSDSTELMLYSARISDLVLKIEKVVVSCDKLENRMGLLLNKRSVLQLAQTYVQIINTYIEDPETIEKISEEMISVTKEVSNVSE
jgi:hypothetical protein